MRIENDFKDFLSYLNKKRVNYCIAGGFSVIYYSRPRYTGDLDILIESSLENSKKIYERMI